MFDPPSGLIVTANQPVVPSDYSALIGIDHAYGYRADRITDLLAGRSGLRAADMVDIQMDNFDGSAGRVVPAILQLDDAASEAIDEMQSVLERWATLSDPFQMSADSPGAAAYAAVWRHLLALTFDELGEDQAAGGNSRYFEVVSNLLDVPDDDWWDIVASDAVESAPDVLARAVSDAHTELTELLGSDPDGWRWGDLHRASFENQTLGQSGIAPIEMLFNRSAPPDVSGGSAIVNATGWIAPEGYDLVSLPSFRMVVDLANFDNSLSIHMTGQSGHAFHPHYFDMAEDWAEGRMRSLPFDPNTFRPETVLTLDPAG